MLGHPSWREQKFLSSCLSHEDAFLPERRRKWEEAELAKLKAKGKITALPRYVLVASLTEFNNK